MVNNLDYNGANPLWNETNKFEITGYFVQLTLQFLYKDRTNRDICYGEVPIY